MRWLQQISFLPTHKRNFDKIYENETSEYIEIFYRNDYEKSKSGIRQKLNKSVIFQGL